jgi:hypothetical protein
LAERAGRHHPSVESPEPAINQAAAWAIRRVGGHLRLDPARAIAAAPWDDDDTDALVDDAKRWVRVGGDGVIDAHEFLGRLLGGLLGARVDGLGGRLELQPSLPAGWKRLVLRRVRANRTLLDLEIKARAEWLTIKLAVMFGPPMPMVISSPVHSVSRVSVDEIPMVGPRALFTAAGEHEVTLFYGV